MSRGLLMSGYFALTSMRWVLQISKRCESFFHGLNISYWKTVSVLGLADQGAKSKHHNSWLWTKDSCSKTRSFVSNLACHPWRTLKCLWSRATKIKTQAAPTHAKSQSKLFNLCLVEKSLEITLMLSKKKHSLLSPIKKILTTFLVNKRLNRDHPVSY